MLKVAVCDDDRECLELTCRLLDEYRSSRLPELQFLPFSSAFGLLSAIECGEHFDIAILDIIMPTTNGIEAAAEIRRWDESMEILFLSSSSEFAVDSYSVQARNYILKPIDRQKLFSALDQVISAMSLGSQTSFFIRDHDGGITRIVHSHLVYCEVICKDILFYMADGHTVTCKKTLIELMKELGSNETFIQPHRSFLVNLNHIQRFTKTELTLTGDKTIPIARAKSAAVLEAFVNHSFNSFLA